MGQSPKNRSPKAPRTVHLSHGDATVHAEDLAGDVVGGDQVGHGVGYVLRGSHVSQGDGGQERIVGLALGHVGGDEAGGDGVATDALGGQLLGDGLGQTNEPRLGGGVIALAASVPNPYFSMTPLM